MLWVCSEHAAHISTRPYFTSFHSFANVNFTFVREDTDIQSPSGIIPDGLFDICRTNIGAIFQSDTALGMAAGAVAFWQRGR